MNLLQWMKQFLHKTMSPSALRPSQQSISTPLGYVPYHARVVNPDASLEHGIERARRRDYAVDGIPFGREMTDEEDATFWQEHPELTRFREEA